MGKKAAKQIEKTTKQKKAQQPQQHLSNGHHNKKLPIDVNTKIEENKSTKNDSKIPPISNGYVKPKPNPFPEPELTIEEKEELRKQKKKKKNAKKKKKKKKKKK